MKLAGIEEILSTRYRVEYKYRINFEKVGHGNKDLMNEWCENKCQGRWRSETQFALYWQFEEENDAFLFKLKWGASDENRLA